MASPSSPTIPAAGPAAPVRLDQAPPARMSWRGDLVTVILSAWLIGGLFIDGWAHNTRPQLETFFTPWHAVFYSGFAASAAWMAWSVWSRRRAGAAWRASVPAGYGPALAGLVLFGASGVGDMAWHLAFGIERNIAALLSPTHLGLFTGAFLVVTAPLRSAWADPGLGRRVRFGRLAPAVVSATLAGSLCGFMFMYLHPAYENIVSVGRQAFLEQFFTSAQLEFVAKQNVAGGVAGFMLGTVFLLGPVLYLLRRWDLPAGTVLVVAGAQFVLIQGLTGFEDAGLAVLGLAGAVGVELLLRALRPRPSSLLRLRGFCAGAPVVLWGVWFAGIALHDHGLGWKAEIWGGALVWSGLTLLALSLLLLPAPVPAERA
jgi:hypothetical protein